MVVRTRRACRIGLLLLVPLYLAILTACSGSHQDPGIAGLELPASGTGGSVSLPALPADTPVAAEELVARRGNYTMTQVRLGDECYAQSSNAITFPDQHLMKLLPEDQQPSWVIYQFTNVVESDFPATIKVDMLPGLTKCHYFGLPDHERGVWEWKELGEQADSHTFGIAPWMNVVSPGGNVYAAFLCWDDDDAVILRVSYNAQVSAPPPTGLDASDGPHGRIISLTWEDLAVTYPDLDYDGIIVERTGDISEPEPEWTMLPTLPPGTTAYDDVHDTDMNPLGEDHWYYYRLRTLEGYVPGEPGPVEAGKRWIKPITWVEATDGLYFDRIEVTWEPSPGVDKYLVNDWSGMHHEPCTIAEIYGDENTTFIHTADYPQDYGCEYGREYEYEIIALVDDYYGWGFEPAAMDTGFRIMNPPTDLAATDGSFRDYIELTWTKPHGGYAYIIYRDGRGPENRVTTVSGAETWKDYVVDYEEHVYWLKALSPGADSEFSVPDGGYRNPWRTHVVEQDQWAWNCSMAILDGKPVICYDWKAISEDGLRFARALTPAPVDQSDWDTHTVDVEDAGSHIRSPSLCIVDNMPAIAYGLGSGNELRYARALTAEPASSDDWQIQTVATEDYAGDSCALASLDGMPMIAYESGFLMEYELRFAMATTATPSSSSDWTIHLVEQADITPNISLINYNGVPVIARGDKDLRIYQANTAYPASSADWHCYNAVGSAYIWDLSLAEIDGKLAVAFCDDWNLKYARALNTTPVSAEDWDVHAVSEPLENYDGYGSMVEFNGVPAIVWPKNDPEGHGIRSLVSAIASTPTPEGLSDWQIRMVQHPELSEWDYVEYVSLAVLGGKLAVSCMDLDYLYFGTMQE